MPKTISFHDVGGPYGCFSNSSPHRIFIVTTWPTCTHYMLAQKHQDSEIWLKILFEPSPTKVAKLCETQNWASQPDWKTMEEATMRIAVRAKVDQHSDVRQTLLSTGNSKIVEHDEGNGFDEVSGNNLLGRIWMEMRDELTQSGSFDELANPLLPPWKKHPEIDRYSIGWRMSSGEDYLSEWWFWFKGLSEAGKRQYCADNPAPEEWEYLYRLKR